MSSNTSDRRRIASSLILALMFLFADLALPQAVPEWNADSLEDEATIAQTTYSSSASKDTSIDSTSPNTNFGSDGTVDFGISISGESRILISFNNTVPTGEMVTDAILELTCGIDLADVDDIKIFSSRMKKSWDEGNATWNNRDVGVVWGVNGAYDDSDHDTWEPPFNGYGNNTFSINVTALVQDAVINSRSSIDLLLAAFGPLYTCLLYTSPSPRD